MTDEPRRIKPEEVRAAYLKMGWKPTQCNWQDSLHGCGCGIGVQMAANGDFSLDGLDDEELENDTPNHVYIAVKSLGISRAYIAGFVTGFDWTESGETPPDEPLAVQGFADGLVCWQAVRDLAESEASK